MIITLVSLPLARPSNSPNEVLAIAAAWQTLSLLQVRVFQTGSYGIISLLPATGARVGLAGEGWCPSNSKMPQHSQHHSWILGEVRWRIEQHRLTHSFSPVNRKGGPSPLHII